MSNDAAIKPIAVLDSNVIISGLAFEHGNPTAILDLLWEGRIQVYISPFIFEEVSRALRGNKFQWSESRVDEVITFLGLYCTLIDPSATLSLDDLSPEDNRILDCAVEGQVQYVITGDRGFQRLGEYQGIVIVNPGDFVTIIQQK